ncbi:MAG: cell division protein ZapA [Acidobacteriaceae bacterium]|jgi:cell division protein ZapA
MADNLEVRRATTSISVDIYDQTYHLRAHDPDYIQKLASTVDAKMRAVSASGNTVDSLRVAVLAALNIADELMRLQEHCRQLRGSVSESQTHLRSRANSLSGLLDSVLDPDDRYHASVPTDVNTGSSLANQLR